MQNLRVVLLNASVSGPLSVFLNALGRAVCHTVLKLFFSFVFWVLGVASVCSTERRILKELINVLLLHLICYSLGNSNMKLILSGFEF